MTNDHPKTERRISVDGSVRHNYIVLLLDFKTIAGKKRPVKNANENF